MVHPERHGCEVSTELSLDVFVFVVLVISAPLARESLFRHSL